MQLKIVQQFVGLSFVAVGLVVQSVSAQTEKINVVTDKAVGTQKSTAPPAIAASAAYAEVYASKAEAEADLKVLLIDLTEEAPLARKKKYELDFLTLALHWLEVLPAQSNFKLTLELGKLVVRKAQVQADLEALHHNYADDHPLVKKARTRLTVYNGEIEKLLQ